MKHTSKQLIFFMTLVVLANALFAAQMNIAMLKPIDSTKTIESMANMQSIESSQHCHGEDASTAATDHNSDCCDGDCSNCVPSTHLSSSFVIKLSQNFQASLNISALQPPLAAHKANLYKPPINS